MPQLEVHTYTSQLFWLVVTFVPLYFVLLKVALPRIRGILEDRQTRIDQDLGRASKLRDEAEEVRTAYEAELAKARGEAQERLRAIAEQAAETAAKRHEDLTEKLTQELSAAEQRIAEARREASGNIRSIAEDLAAAAASRLSGASVAPDDVSGAVEAAMQGRK